MTQNFIQPKGSLKTQVDTSNLQSQLAQMFADKQLQNQAQAQANAEDETRQTVNELLKKKLIADVEMPQFTTIQDIFKAPTGQKLETFGQFLNTPNGQNALGSIASLLTGGRYYTTPADAYNQQLQRDMAIKQSQAMQQMKEQNDIATALNSAYMQSDLAKERNQLQRDLAKEEMEFKKQEAALDRALKREGLNAQIQHQKAMEIIAKQRLTASNTQQKQLQKNMDALNSLNAVQSQMDRFTNSFKDVRPTKLGALMAGEVAKHGLGNTAEANFNAQRTLLFNKIARELGGEKGVLSDQDIKRIEASLPALSDSLPQKKAKMQAIYNLLDDRKSQYGGAVSAGMASQLNSQPLTVGGYTIEIE